MLLLSGCGTAEEESRPAASEAETAADPTAAMSAEELAALAREKQEQGDYTAALDALDQAIALGSDKAGLYLQRAELFLYREAEEDNLDKALADYQSALALESSTEAHMGIADVYVRQNDFEGAIAYLERAGDDPAILEKLDALRAGQFLDASGRIRRRDCFGPSGDLLWYHLYFYNENREMEAVAYNAAGEEVDRAQMRYDEQGRITQHYGYASETGLFTLYQTTYREDGSSLQECRDEQGQLTGYVSYMENEQGQTIRMDDYGPEMDLRSYTLMEYTERGQPLRNAIHTPDGTLITLLEWVYDEQGRQVDYRYTSDGKFMFHVVTLYDENGQPTERVTYDANEQVTRRDVVSFG